MLILYVRKQTHSLSHIVPDLVVVILSELVEMLLVAIYIYYILLLYYPSKGVSNSGGIKLIGSCLISIRLNNFNESGIRSVSNLNNEWLNKVKKSVGRSSLSYKHDFNFSATSLVSGTKWYSGVAFSLY